MFEFWKRKKDPEEKLYPNFRARLFAALVDLALAAFVLSPILGIASSVIYGDSLPSKKLAILISKLPNASKDFAYFSQSMEYKAFIEAGGYKGIFIEQIVQMFLFAVLVFIFWLKKGATPGKMFLSMQIVDYKTFKKATLTQLTFRLCAYIISFLPLGAGIFYIAFNKKRRGWHDIIAGTVVVNKSELAKVRA